MIRPVYGGSAESPRSRRQIPRGAAYWKYGAAILPRAGQLAGFLRNRQALTVTTGHLALRMMNWAVEPNSSFWVRERFSMPTNIRSAPHSAA